jgi:hypothetical protein
VPKQIKDVFEEFTQMYEKSKRTNKGSDAQQESKAKQRAIILTWNINYGECQLQTYRISDKTQKKFVVKASCLQGLVLLCFSSAETNKSANDIAKSLGVVTAKQVQPILENLATKLLLFKKEDNNKYQLSESFNQDNESVVSLMPSIEELQQQDDKNVADFDF